MSKQPRRVRASALPSTTKGRSAAGLAPDPRSTENLWAYVGRLEARLAVVEKIVHKPRTFMQRVMGDG